MAAVKQLYISRSWHAAITSQVGFTLDQGLNAVEDPRRGTETNTAKRRTDGLTPPLGTIKSGNNCFRRPELDKQLSLDIIASQTNHMPARISCGFNFFRVLEFGPCS